MSRDFEYFGRVFLGGLNFRMQKCERVLMIIYDMSRCNGVERETKMDFHDKKYFSVKNAWKLIPQN